MSDKWTHVAAFIKKYYICGIAFKTKINFWNAAYLCFNHGLVFLCDHHFLSSFKTVVKNISYYFLALFVESGHTCHMIAHLT